MVMFTKLKQLKIILYYNIITMWYVYLLSLFILSIMWSITNLLNKQNNYVGIYVKYIVDLKWSNFFFCNFSLLLICIYEYIFIIFCPLNFSFINHTSVTKKKNYVCKAYSVSVLNSCCLMTKQLIIIPCRYNILQ